MLLGSRCAKLVCLMIRLLSNLLLRLALQVGVVLFLPILQSVADDAAKFVAVQVSAVGQLSPPRIILSWPGDTNATNFSISRKVKDTNVWSALVTLGGTASNYTDAAVSVGSAFEYKIVKNTSTGYIGYGYIFAGINAPLIENRGKLILIVENTFTNDLAAELSRLQQDLIGDGWTVMRHDVNRTNSVPSVKALIKADYTLDPTNTTAVFLFGRVPVPYSGNIAPDGHANHQGAWPADGYYGEMVGVWTDNTVTATNAERTRNWNVPGDGKFDQSQFPADVKLQVGRVDLFDMTCYSVVSPPRYEKDLLRQYLNKDHNFRHGLLPVQRRGFITDNFVNTGTDPVACSGWRNFAAFFGASNITESGPDTFFPTLATQSYLWSYGSGGGQYYYCFGVGNSDNFATNDPKVVFTMLMGSKFGDWDTESNILRSPLGATSYILTCSYSGAPQTFYHHMALGETIGYSMRLSQNNVSNGLYVATQGTYLVHTALMGDPSLRLHPVIPPTNLQAFATSSGGVILNWRTSTDTSIQGYHVYRSSAAMGPFTRLTTSLITTNTFTDSFSSSNYTYMIRAIKLEQSASGTYLNPSQGVFITVPPAIQISKVKATNGVFGFHLMGQGSQSFAIESSTNLSNWTQVQSNALVNGSFDFTDPAILSSSVRYYRVSATP